MDFKTYIYDQLQEALRYKWLQGEKIGHDPGERAIAEWIEKYAADYRRRYDECYERIVRKVTEACMGKIKDLAQIDEQQAKALVILITDELTRQWTLEMNNGRDPHVKEI